MPGDREWEVVKQKFDGCTLIIYNFMTKLFFSLNYLKHSVWQLDTLVQVGYSNMFLQQKI